MAEVVGTVNERGVTKKGAPKIKVDGQWYFAGRAKVDTIQVGDRVSMEVKAFGERGDLWGIEKWAIVPADKTNGNGHPAVSGDAEQRFISNCVGQAIVAGLIKEPKQIAAWVLGAKAALLIEHEPFPEVDDEDPGDKIPF